MIEGSLVARVQHDQHVDFRCVRSAELPTLRRTVAEVAKPSRSFRRRHSHLKLAWKSRHRVARQAELLQTTAGERDIILSAGKFIFAAAALGRADLIRDMSQPAPGGLSVGDSQQDKSRIVQMSVTVEHNALDILKIKRGCRRRAHSNCRIRATSRSLVAADRWSRMSRSFIRLSTVSSG